MANSCSVVEPNYRSSTFPRKRWNRQSWQIDKNSEAFSTNFFKGIRFFIKKANPGHFFVHFRSFQTTIEFLQQMYVKNVHPGYGAGIRTHDLWNVSLFPTLSRDKLASLANVFFNNGPFSASFLYFSSFQCSWQKAKFNKKLQMTVFEPRTSGIGSNCFINWSTPTAPNMGNVLRRILNPPFIWNKHELIQVGFEPAYQVQSEPT